MTTQITPIYTTTEAGIVANQVAARNVPPCPSRTYGTVIRCMGRLYNRRRSGATGTHALC